LWHAHVGWLFSHSPTSWRRYANDLLNDRDLVVITRLFPLWCLLSLAMPFGVGWAFGGLGGALTALLWAGGVRIAVLHHVTWSVNSLCHTIGRRPFLTRDRSRNLAALSILSFGESWHNGHHAYPHSARHGILRHQVDSSASLIRLLERAGWVRNVRWAPRPGA
jgi:stearoyl-CoA desaturase (delta-9 desaturase)